jgi:hypothetical protein
MAKLTIHVPRWYAGILLMISVALGILWVQDAYDLSIDLPNGTLSVFIGSIVVLAVIASTVYVVVTGKVPFTISRSA